MDNFENILNNSSRFTADLTVEKVGNNPKHFKSILYLTLNKDSPINWRAARVVVLASKKHPELFEPYANFIAEKFPTFKTAGLKRVFPIALAYHINKISDKNKIQLIDTCFKYTISEKEDIAVRVNCMQLIYEIQKDIPELSIELKLTIELILQESESHALKARAKMILKKLN